MSTARRYPNEDIEDFFENAALSLHWVGADGTILRANRFELDFLGYAREEYEGRSIKDFHVDEDAIDDILARLTRGETISDYPARLRAKDGSIRHVLINSNVRWVDGEFAHTRCFTRDVTDHVAAERALAEAKAELERKVEERTAALQRANEELTELVELRRRFVAIVSHELRTPLTSIAGFTLTMQRYWEALPDDQKRTFVEIIGNQSYRLTRLVEELLLVTRISSGALHIEPETVDVVDAVAHAASELGLDGIEIACGADARVHADRDHVHRILLNLLSNAAKYGAPPICASAGRAGDAVELRVADAGPGVPQSLVPQLFEEFAAASDAGDVSSTGLGLAIVRHLARAHGGDAWYEGEPGAGAVFAVRLPAAA